MECAGPSSVLPTSPGRRSAPGRTKGQVAAEVRRDERVQASDCRVLAGLLGERYSWSSINDGFWHEFRSDFVTPPKTSQNLRSAEI